MKLDNGRHKYHTPHFEWWYFHFISTNGYYFSLILHPTDIFAVNNNAYMSVSMITPENDIFYFREDLSDNVFDNCNERLLCENEKVTIIEESNIMNLKVVFDNLVISGIIQKEHSRVIFNDGILFEDKKRAVKNYWIVTIPYGIFKFNIKLFNKQITLRGSLYHDHNWGNAKIQDHFQDWVWGHLLFKNGFLLFYQVRTSNNTLIKKGFLKYDITSFKFSDYKVKGRKKNKYLSSLNLPSDFNVEIPMTNQHAIFRIKSDNVFRKREDYKYKEFVPFYFRSKCSSSNDILGKINTAHGLIEYLSIRRKC